MASASSGTTSSSRRGWRSREPIRPNSVRTVVVAKSGEAQPLPEPKPGDLLAIMTAGAYGAVQSGFYNTRALVPEVLVKDDQYAVVRPRIEVDELIAMDRTAPWL